MSIPNNAGMHALFRTPMHAKRRYEPIDSSLVRDLMLLGVPGKQKGKIRITSFEIGLYYRYQKWITFSIVIHLNSRALYVLDS